ncbi:MAG: hypothetical protein PHX01_06475 [Clostridia bacterium]|jgi:hypothetical protein|nr:hypothetical protein [Clostridia bacterium]
MRADKEAKGAGFNPGLILGLIIGSGCFWLTIKIVQIVSQS